LGESPNPKERKKYLGKRLTGIGERRSDCRSWAEKQKEKGVTIDRRGSARTRLKDAKNGFQNGRKGGPTVGLWVGDRERKRF